MTGWPSQSRDVTWALRVDLGQREFAHIADTVNTAGLSLDRRLFGRCWHRIPLLKKSTSREFNCQKQHGAAYIYDAEMNVAQHNMLRPDTPARSLPFGQLLPLPAITDAMQRRDFEPIWIFAVEEFIIAPPRIIEASSKNSKYRCYSRLMNATAAEDARFPRPLCVSATWIIVRSRHGD